MIELTKDQQAAIDAGLQPPAFVDPRSGQEYFLIRRQTYQKMQGILRPFNRGWDDPALDVYEQYRKKP